MTLPPGIEKGLRLNAPSAVDAAGEPRDSSGWNQKRSPQWQKRSGWAKTSNSSSGVLFVAWEPGKALSNIPTAIASFSIRRLAVAPSIRRAQSSAELGLSGHPISRTPRRGSRPHATAQAAIKAPSTLCKKSNNGVGSERNSEPVHRQLRRRIIAETYLRRPTCDARGAAKDSHRQPPPSARPNWVQGLH